VSRPRLQGKAPSGKAPSDTRVNSQSTVHVLRLCSDLLMRLQADVCNDHAALPSRSKCQCLYSEHATVCTCVQVDMEGRLRARYTGSVDGSEQLAARRDIRTLLAGFNSTFRSAYNNMAQAPAVVRHTG
jgi:hypothetical protein